MCSNPIIVKVSPPADLWGRVVMQNESWVELEVGMLGGAAQEQCP